MKIIKKKQDYSRVNLGSKTVLKVCKDTSFVKFGPKIQSHNKYRYEALRAKL